MILFVIADSLELISSATQRGVLRIKEFQHHTKVASFGWLGFNKITKNHILVHRFWCPGSPRQLAGLMRLWPWKMIEKEADQTIQVYLQDLRCWLQVDPMLAEQLAGNALAPLGPHSFFETKKTVSNSIIPKSGPRMIDHPGTKMCKHLQISQGRNTKTVYDSYKQRIGLKFSVFLWFSAGHMSYCKGWKPRPAPCPKSETCPLESGWGLPT